MQGIQSNISTLKLTIAPYYYNNETSKDLLCLQGTVLCRYRGNQYNIPVEIWLQQDHPIVASLAYVKPTPDMHVATTSNDVRPDGTVIIPYLRNWRHVKHICIYACLYSVDFYFIVAKQRFDKLIECNVQCIW
jgi:hypothetical protein